MHAGSSKWGLRIMKRSMAGRICWILATASAVGLTTSGTRARPPREPARPRPNILFIFSDDHAFQADQRLQRPPQADRDASHRSPGPRRNAIRPMRRAELHLRAQPGVGLDRQVFSPQRLLQQHQQPLRRLADRRSPSCSRPPATRPPSSASGTWSASRPGSTNGKSCRGRGSTTIRR